MRTPILLPAITHCGSCGEIARPVFVPVVECPECSRWWCADCLLPCVTCGTQTCCGTYIETTGACLDNECSQCLDERVSNERLAWQHDHGMRGVQEGRDM